MRFGILADLHANLEAVKAVRADSRSRGIDEWFVLGDLVGYGPDPNAVVEAVYDFVPETNIVIGNHDLEVAPPLSHYLMGIAFPLERRWSADAITAVRWTQKQLSPANTARLQKLTESERYLITKTIPSADGSPERRLIFTHASPRDPEGMGYTFEFYHAKEHFFDDLILSKNARAFVGHTHIPQLYQTNNGTAISSMDHRLVAANPHTVLSDYSSAFAVVHSVGQPRHGNPRAGYAIYDSAKDSIQFIEVEYDFKPTQKKLFDAGLPPSLRKRLATGDMSGQ